MGRSIAINPCRPLAPQRAGQREHNGADENPDKPQELEATMRMLLDGSAVQVKQLEDLDGESRVVLIRRLIREGLLECVG